MTLQMHDKYSTTLVTASYTPHWHLAKELWSLEEAYQMSISGVAIFSRAMKGSNKDIKNRSYVKSRQR